MDNLSVSTGTIENGVPLLFAGGPVSALAWCPTPLSLGEEQVLAVSTLSSMDALPPLCETSTAPGLIQLWSVSDITNTGSCVKTPHLVMALGHKWGTVRQLAWCPSGCWSPEHYGLLAAACADGSIRLISIPKCDTNQLFFHAKVHAKFGFHNLNHIVINIILLNMIQKF